MLFIINFYAYLERDILLCKLNVKWSIQVRNEYLNYTVRHVTNTSFYDKVISEITTDSKMQGTRYFLQKRINKC